MKYSISLILLLFVTSIFCQEQLDTVFYNKKWLQCSKQESVYYRISEKEGSGFNVTNYYKNGAIQMRGFFSSLQPDIRNGKIISYYKNGKILSEEHYQNNIETGEWKNYDSTGFVTVLKYLQSGKEIQRISYLYYKNGSYQSIDSIFNNGRNVKTFFYENGNKKMIEIVVNRKFVSRNCFSLSGQDTICNTEEIYTYVEKMPEFPGGMSQLYKYLSKNIRFPQEMFNKNIQGKVILQFVVDKDGSITNTKVIRGLHELADKEAVRVVEKLPKFTPGYQNGVVVRVYYTLPLNFTLGK